MSIHVNLQIESVQAKHVKNGAAFEQHREILQSKLTPFACTQLRIERRVNDVILYLI